MPVQRRNVRALPISARTSPSTSNPLANDAVPVTLAVIGVEVRVKLTGTLGLLAASEGAPLSRAKRTVSFLTRKEPKLDMAPLPELASNLASTLVTASRPAAVGRFIVPSRRRRIPTGAP